MANNLRTRKNRASRKLRLEQLETRRVFAGLVFDSVILANSDTANIYSSAVAVDDAGNKYMGGRFTGEVDFDRESIHPGNADVLAVRGAGDAFIAKYGPANELLWVRRFGGDASSVSRDSVAHLEVDAEGNIYVAGTFGETADFGPFTLTSEGVEDGVVAKMDSQGEWQWVNRWGGAGNDQMQSMVVDASGTVTVVARTMGSYLTPQILQYGTQGELNWSSDFSTEGISGNMNLVRGNDGEVFVTGFFRGTVDLDPGPEVDLVTGSTDSNSFVMSLSTQGERQWVTVVTPNTDQAADSSIYLQLELLDADGSLVLTGGYRGQVQLSGQSNENLLFPESNADQSFFGRMDSSGVIQEVTFTTFNLAPPSSFAGFEFAQTSFGYLAAGSFQNSKTINDVTYTAQGTFDSLIIELDFDFGVINGSVITGAGFELITGIAIDDEGGIYLSGWSTSPTIDYDLNPYTNVDVSNPSFADAFLLKINEVRPGDEMVLFADSFEVGEWNGRWVHDSQLAWSRSLRRSTTGSYSAEFKGSASDATLTTKNVIDLTGLASATLSFDWFIESTFDFGEYLSLDISTDGGLSWINDVRRLNGNVSAENVWHSEVVDLAPYMTSETKARFRAKANRSDERANVDNVRIVGIVDGPNATPIANAGSGYVMNEGGAITLSAAGSSDPDGSIISYAWDFNGDGIYDDASGMASTFSTTTSGTKTIGLLVTDNRGATASTTTTVIVNNVAPTANAGGDLTGSIGQSITLSAAGSSDPGQDIVSYLWDLDNDGVYGDANGISAIFTSAVAGVFTVGLQVIDADGAVGFDSLMITITSAPVLSTKFYVVDDAGTDRTFEYAADGAAVENYGLASGNTAPRGAASTVAGDKVWVVDANKKVYIYNDSGVLLGSWSAGSLASNATVEGITTNGTDVWLVDARRDRVYRYANAAGRLSGSQNATSSFALNRGNLSPKDLVTDGANIWVVNDNTTDRVFKYTMTGSLVGSWAIDSANSSPTGITLDPSGASQSIWIVDNGTDRVYEYTNARSRNSGSQAAATSFALAAGNGNPQGIADPPVSAGNQAPVVQLESGSPNEDLAFVDQPSNRPRTLGRDLLWVQPNQSRNNRLSSFVQDSVTEQIAPRLTPSRENVAPQRLDHETLWTGSRLVERLDHSSSSQSKATTIKLHGERLRDSLLVAAVDDVFADFA